MRFFPHPAEAFAFWVLGKSWRSDFTEYMSQYWLCSVCISVVDSFSSHCLAFNEPGNKAVGQKQKQKLFQKWGYLGKVKLLDWSKIYFAPPFQPQVGVFFACDISTRVEIKLKSCSDNIWNTLLPGLQFPDVSIKSPKLTSLQCDQASGTSRFFDRGYKS